TMTTPPYNLRSIDNKLDYSSLLLIIKSITMNLHVTVRLDKDLCHSNKPDEIFNTDIIPQRFLVNRSIPCLKSVPCIYQLKKVTKNILAIANHLKWTNQNRIKQWTNLFDDIQIKLTLKYLSLEDKPLSLSTNPLVSRIKNFKVKLIADDLPTH